MNQVILCGTFGNGRDYMIWTMETSADRIEKLIELYQLDQGVIRRVERDGDPVTYYYLLAEWGEVGV